VSVISWRRRAIRRLNTGETFSVYRQFVDTIITLSFWLLAVPWG
jgi:hypothetical protein